MFIHFRGVGVTFLGGRDVHIHVCTAYALLTYKRSGGENLLIVRRLYLGEYIFQTRLNWFLIAIIQIYPNKEK